MSPPHEPSLADNDRTQIIYIRSCRPGRQQIAQMLEEPRRIIIGKKRRRIQTQRCGTFECCLVNQGAGGIIGLSAPAIRSVGVACQRNNAGMPAKLKRKCEGIFLIGAATPISRDGDGEFAARQQYETLAGLCRVAR